MATKIHVGETKGRGKGIFAKKNIKKGETIAAVKGKIFTIKNLKDVKAKRLDGNYLHQIDWNKFINNETITKFTNHSCEPNAAVKEKLPTCRLMALKNIKKGEEITVDYDTFDSGLLGAFKCRCKSKNCRKIIKGYKYLPEKLRKKLNKKYRAYIAKYLLKPQKIQT